MYLRRRGNKATYNMEHGGARTKKIPYSARGIRSVHGGAFVTQPIPYRLVRGFIAHVDNVRAAY